MAVKRMQPFCAAKIQIFFPSIYEGRVFMGQHIESMSCPDCRNIVPLVVGGVIFSSSLCLPALSGFLIVFNLSFSIIIASAFEAQGFQETLKCHCLGFLSFPLALSASAFTLCRSKLRANPFCILGVNSFCQSWQKTL